MNKNPKPTNHPTLDMDALRRYESLYSKIAYHRDAYRIEFQNRTMRGAGRSGVRNALLYEMAANGLAYLKNIAIGVVESPGTAFHIARILEMHALLTFLKTHPLSERQARIFQLQKRITAASGYATDIPSVMADFEKDTIELRSLLGERHSAAEIRTLGLIRHPLAWIEESLPPGEPPAYDHIIDVALSDADQRIYRTASVILTNFGLPRIATESAAAEVRDRILAILKERFDLAVIDTGDTHGLFSLIDITDTAVFAATGKHVTAVLDRQKRVFIDLSTALAKASSGIPYFALAFELIELFHTDLLLDRILDHVETAMEKSLLFGKTVSLFLLLVGMPENRDRPDAYAIAMLNHAIAVRTLRQRSRGANPEATEHARKAYELFRKRYPDTAMEYPRFRTRFVTDMGCFVDGAGRVPDAWDWYKATIDVIGFSSPGLVSALDRMLEARFRHLANPELHDDFPFHVPIAVLHEHVSVMTSLNMHFMTMLLQSLEGFGKESDKPERRTFRKTHAQAMSDFLQTIETTFVMLDYISDWHRTSEPEYADLFKELKERIFPTNH